MSKFQSDTASLVAYMRESPTSDVMTRAANAIEALMSQRNGYIEQHHRDGAELRRLCQQRDDARREADQWKDIAMEKS